MTYNNVCLLISSSAAKAPLIRAARDACARVHPQARVVAGDLNPASISRYLADAFWQMPPVSADYLGAIMEGCRELGINVVLAGKAADLGYRVFECTVTLRRNRGVIAQGPEYAG